MTSREKLGPSTDVHLLYQEAVQSPEVDVRLIDRHYKKLAGKPARLFREDFCGTAALSCAWIELGADRKAIAVDLHAPTLAWGKKNNLAKLSIEQRTRIDLVRSDVRKISRPRVDIVCALNFSYCVFKQRRDMLDYVKNARRSLNPGGMLFMDMWGGSESQTEHRDRTRRRGFIYIWEQRSFDPISFHADCRIHFEFPDGRLRRNAFTYDWRLWTLPELRDIFEEAGLKDIHVLWETSDKNGRGTGVYRRMERTSAEESWVACLVGRA
ncbi:MAG: class I SAM-dependent methyltransferase [Alphaproteobacteria bacterium]|nr:class I SAM-dependent methyltransferase [Alphaproteobacteria bacterium]